MNKLFTLKFHDVDNSASRAFEHVQADACHIGPIAAELSKALGRVSICSDARLWAMFDNAIVVTKRSWSDFYLSDFESAESQRQVELMLQSISR